jgi:hypothetical protein
MIELVSGMPVPLFGDKFSWMRGSEEVHDSCASRVSFWLMNDVFAYPLRCLGVPLGLHVPYVEDTGLEDMRFS